MNGNESGFIRQVVGLVNQERVKAGASYRRFGENIAWGQRSPEAVVNAWMNSAGHRANILNANFGRIGVGYLTNNSGTPYWVQLFTD